MGAGAPCGSLIDFRIAAVTDNGSFSDTFQLMTGASGQSRTVYTSTTPTPIPDANGVLRATSTLSVVDTLEVRDVDVTVDITHAYDEDLDIFLIAPDGTRVELSTDNGGSGADYTGTVFDDEAATSITAGTAPFTGRFRPEGPASSLYGIAANGTWTLEITDDAVPDAGVLTGWSLALTTGPDVLCHSCAVAAPTGLPSVRWTAASKTRLEWDAVSGATFYNVYRGVPAGLPELLDPDIDSCRRMTTTTPITENTLAETPGAGSLYWFLVRAGNAGGEGPAGAATAGPRSQDSSGACP